MTVLKYYVQKLMHVDICDKTEGFRYGTPVVTPVIVPYVGSHDTVIAYGSLTADGRQFFQTYDRFNATTFVEYLKSMYRYFGKIVVIMDRATPSSCKTSPRFVNRKQRDQNHLSVKRIIVS